MTEAEATQLERLEAAIERLEEHARNPHVWRGQLVRRALAEARANVLQLVINRPLARAGVSTHRG